ncbi:MAG: hypothetical protein IAG13_38000, partial [Deltaproteobacteria bacterium]|nr:hypothetical protein [Nannocystaceae bacterium]
GDDDSDPSAPTGTDEGDPTAGGEVCNGLDDDGDGEIDEDVPELACGIGTCEVNVDGCEGGVPAQCFPGSPGAESCNGLDDDCDGSSDEELVQACASACGAGTQSCNGGAWSACDAPPPQAEVCNIVDDDCNAAVDDGVPGCRVWVHRWYHPVTGEHFYSTDANEGLCCGFQLEFMNYFQLYAGAQAGVTGLYRCYGANGFHHYTTDPFCEGLPGNEGVMGYIGTADLPGSTELYRSYYAVNGDHFFTTSFAEHTAAVGSGYVDEGAVGWVW